MDEWYQLRVVLTVGRSPITMGNCIVCPLRCSEIFADEPRVSVDTWEGLTTQYAMDHNIQFLIRGLRPTGDFDSEYMMARINHKLNRDLETVFLISDSKTDYISSSMVKEVLSYGGPIDDFVPPIVLKYLSQLPKKGC